MIEQIHLEKNKGNNYHGIQWDEQTQKKKTWQWEVVATQAYLKNMNALFITHGQSIIIYGSEVAPESNSMICRAKTD